MSEHPGKAAEALVEHQDTQISDLQKKIKELKTENQDLKNQLTAETVEVERLRTLLVHSPIRGISANGMW